MEEDAALTTLPATIQDEEQLDDLLSRPGPALVESMKGLEGDLIILGAGGKMGPTLARMARRAMNAAGADGRVIGVSRFSDSRVREQLERWGVETVVCDLLDRDQVAQLPDGENIVFMAGRKFGSSGNEPLTWAMNCHVPALAAERYAGARFVVFSTGNVYPFVPVTGRGATEETSPQPIGEYAQSCLGRERIFQHFAATSDTPTVIIRLNYAVEMRYGVLVDIATQVMSGRPVDVTMGHVNVIWQGDACDQILRSFPLAASPARVLNITGLDVLRVRDLVESFARAFDVTPQTTGQEAPTALLNDASLAAELLGKPPTPVERIIDWTADWLQRGGPQLGKPTHFEQREGQF